MFKPTREEIAEAMKKFMQAGGLVKELPQEIVPLHAKVNGKPPLICDSVLDEWEELVT